VNLEATLGVGHRNSPIYGSDPIATDSRIIFDCPSSEILGQEAICKDRNAYSISLVEPDGTTITSLTCRELLATSKRLLHRAGSRSRGAIAEFW
jgi:hypothetical protein